MQWEYKSYLSTQMWKTRNFVFKNIIYFMALFDIGKETVYKYRILLLSPCDKWDAVRRWGLLRPAFGGWWSECGEGDVCLTFNSRSTGIAPGMHVILPILWLSIYADCSWDTLAPPAWSLQESGSVHSISVTFEATGIFTRLLEFLFP